MKKIVLILSCLIILASYARVTHSGLDPGTPDTPYPCYDPQDHGDTWTQATTVLQDSITYGKLCPGDVDWFKVTYYNNYGHDALMFKTSGNTDTVGYLYRYELKYNGLYWYYTLSFIAANDNSGSGNNFKISTYPFSGLYYIKVKHKSATGIGTYRLYVNGYNVR